MTEPLTCIECGRVQPAGARGWKAYLTVDEDEPAEAVVYCPECAERELGVNLRRGRLEATGTSIEAAHSSHRMPASPRQ